jgi:Flp pilus assembly protein TadG
VTGRSAAQDGSVSVVLAALLGMILVTIMGTADAATVLLAASRAQDAADAAALAVAQELAMPSGRDPHDVAIEYAARNGASIVTCACDSGSLEATVTVRTAVGTLLLFPDDRVADASARAVVDPS